MSEDLTYIECYDCGHPCLYEGKTRREYDREAAMVGDRISWGESPPPASYPCFHCPECGAIHPVPPKVAGQEVDND